MKYGKVVYILDVSMKILNKAVTRSRKSNKDIYNKMNKRERKKRQTMVHKLLHRKLNIEQQKPNLKVEMNSFAPEG